MFRPIVAYISEWGVDVETSMHQFPVAPIVYCK